jgi:hypothetical protein
MSIDWTMLVATQSVVQKQVLATSVRRYSNESARNSGKLVMMTLYVYGPAELAASEKALFG